MRKITALNGLWYRPTEEAEEKRVEIGQDCSDLPESDIEHLLAQGDIAIEDDAA